MRATPNEPRRSREPGPIWGVAADLLRCCIVAAADLFAGFRRISARGRRGAYAVRTIGRNRSAWMFTCNEPYRERPTRFLGVRAVSGWRLKVYSIRHDSATTSDAEMEHGLLAAAAELPTPAVGEGRPGVGFAVLHAGRGVDYAVLAWWARENELPLRVWVHGRRDGAAWRRATGEESICVWDLRVIAHERDAYVRTVLTARPDIDAYLRATPGDSY